MAVMLIGFGCLLLACAMGAYFAGLHSARGRVAPVVITTATPSSPSVAVDSRDTHPAEKVPDSLPPAGFDVPVEERTCKSAPHASNRLALHGPFADSRAHDRLKFEGTALATIYPREGQSRHQPVECIVSTRDLSRTGIGIMHVEQLYPRQMIVLNAVGKVLVGEVRWCRRVSSNFYVAGCRLVKTIA
jgi:hypothetical protein